MQYCERNRNSFPANEIQVDIGAKQTGFVKLERAD